MAEIGFCGTRDLQKRFSDSKIHPDDSNFQGKLKLLRVVGVSSYWGFEEKTKKHLIKGILCLHVFWCKVSTNVEA